MSYIKEYDFNLSDKIIFPEADAKIIDWNEHFKNNNGLVVEVGCGNGHFLTTIAKSNPNLNYIGVDIKEKRLIRCREKEIKYNINNTAWICGEASLALSTLFKNESVIATYMPFSDPWPKRRHHKNRLFQKKFLDILSEKLVKSGIFIFITDYKEYYETSFKIAKSDDRFEIVDNLQENTFNSSLPELENSVFGQRWKQDNRDFYSFYLKKK